MKMFLRVNSLPSEIEKSEKKIRIKKLKKLALISRYFFNSVKGQTNLVPFNPFNKVQYFKHYISVNGILLTFYKVKIFIE
jgi:hypothetical protein